MGRRLQKNLVWKDEIKTWDWETGGTGVKVLMQKGNVASRMMLSETPKIEPSPLAINAMSHLSIRQHMRMMNGAEKAKRRPHTVDTVIACIINDHHLYIIETVMIVACVRMIGDDLIKTKKE